MDAFSPAAPALDTHLQAIELLRDPSHVRDYTLAEWIAALGRAGFQMAGVEVWRLPLDFASWIRRMRTPAVQADAVRALQNAASDTVRRHYAIADDGSFTLDVMMIRAA
jgi:hypothetical protein